LSLTLSPAASWAGNFRDLNAAVARMATLVPGGRISTQVVDKETSRLSSVWDKPDTSQPGVDLEQLPTLWKNKAPLIASGRQDFQPEFSPDETKIVFTADRSGPREIWVTDGDGANPMRVTQLGNSGTGRPRWFQDGAQIALDSRLRGVSDIYLVSLSATSFGVLARTVSMIQQVGPPMAGGSITGRIVLGKCNYGECRPRGLNGGYLGKVRCGTDRQVEEHCAKFYLSVDALLNHGTTHSLRDPLISNLSSGHPFVVHFDTIE
jgi:hypothetical protein